MRRGQHMLNWDRLLTVGVVAMAALALGGCTHQVPTIAHTHIGHAITAFDGTPEDKGLFVVAEERMTSAVALAAGLSGERPGAEQATETRALIEMLAGEDYGFTRALREAESHVVFAAEADDASANVKASAARFSQGVADVLRRSDLATLLAGDLVRSSDDAESAQLVAQIQDLVNRTADGAGADELEVGVAQLREMMDAMVANESPPYVTVDRWYLFHLVRLPDCDTCWAWRKWANSSNRGY